MRYEHLLAVDVALALLSLLLARRIVQPTVALIVVGVVQVVLGIAGGDTAVLGGLHALNALVYVGLAAVLVRRANPGLGRRSA